MNEVLTGIIDEKVLDSQGAERRIQTTSVITSAEFMKKLEPAQIAALNERMASVRVTPHQEVSEDFMRDTNRFVQL